MSISDLINKTLKKANVESILGDLGVMQIAGAISSGASEAEILAIEAGLVEATDNTPQATDLVEKP